MTKGIIFKIERYALHDGPGIRTVFFLKGCPLRCKWCANPEGIHPEPQIVYRANKCIGCGNCVSICPQNLHRVKDRKHYWINRDKCEACGLCVEKCYAGALEMVGQSMSVTQAVNIAMEDYDYYKKSGGGLTLSGGEPLYQHEFVLSLLKAVKKKKIHVCIETCGFVKWEIIDAVRPFVDIFLFDIKELNTDLHEEFTGVPNQLILENLYRLDRAGSKIILRCPIIPERNMNEKHFENIAELFRSIGNAIRCDILPYHRTGDVKYQLLGKENPMGTTPPVEKEEVRNIENKLRKLGVDKVHVS